MRSIIHKVYGTWIIKFILTYSILFIFCSGISAQDPPRPIQIVKTADLAFGTFYSSTGGTITVSTSGIRTGIGVFTLGMGSSAAVFRISGNAGTMFTFSFLSPTVTLNGTPLGTMTLHLGPTDPISPIILNSFNNTAFDLYVGGTLDVGDPLTSPPGSYIGSFTIVFNQN